MAALTWAHTPATRNQWVERWAVRASWALLFLAPALLAAIGLDIVQHFSSHTEVRVFEVNSQGEPVGEVRTLQGTGLIIDKVFRSQINNFLRAAFTITDHVSEQKAFMAEVEAQCDQNTWDKIKAFWAIDENNPKTNMGRVWQEVKPLGWPHKLPEADTYQVKWTLIRHDYYTGNVTQRVFNGTMRAQADNSIDPSPFNTFAIKFSGFDFSEEGR